MTKKARDDKSTETRIPPEETKPLSLEADTYPHWADAPIARVLAAEHNIRRARRLTLDTFDVDALPRSGRKAAHAWKLERLCAFPAPTAKLMKKHRRHRQAHRAARESPARAARTDDTLFEAHLGKEVKPVTWTGLVIE